MMLPGAAAVAPGGSRAIGPSVETRARFFGAGAASSSFLGRFGARVGRAGAGELPPRGGGICIVVRNQAAEILEDVYPPQRLIVRGELLLHGGRAPAAAGCGRLVAGGARVARLHPASIAAREEVAACAH